MIDKNTIAIVSILGSSLDVLGALYLAYDLLGGEHGPLRTLTRIVTYGALFGVPYGLAAGLLFGLVCGIAHGVTLGWEYARAARHGPKPGFWYDVAMSAIRGAGFAAGASFVYGLRFGITFGVLSTVGQVIAYQLGIRPTLDYAQSARPRITLRQFLAAVNRTVGYGFAGYISALVGHQRTQALTYGVRAGLIIGAVSAIFTACMPFVEWNAERMAPKRMGVVGVICIVTGFALQSVQYWITLAGIAVG